MPKTTRHTSKAFEIKPHLCVFGSAAGGPQPVPITEHGEVQCVAFNAYVPWIANVLEGKSRAQDSSGAVVAFVRSLKVALGGGDADGDSPAGGGSCPGGGGSCPKRGREAMGLDDDSDEADLQELSGKRPARRSKGQMRAARIEKTALKSVTAEGMQLTARLSPKGLGVLVPVEGDSLSLILNHLKTQVESGQADPDARFHKTHAHDAEDKNTTPIRGTWRAL